MSKLSFAAGLLILAACNSQAAPIDSVPQNAQEIEGNRSAVATTSFQAEANGITVTASNFRVEQMYFVADVCFERPIIGLDWLIGDQTVLEYNTQSSRVFEIGLLVPETDIESAVRCDFVRFPLGNETINKFRIVIPFLQTSFATHDCDGAQAKLNAANTGITISCYSQALDNGGMEGYRIETKPEALSDDEANRLIYDAFVETVYGPWIFEGEID
ncbi:MAG: hypothetical protein KIS88_09095 [Anaerolineales bacterium]|nr:hypothetical protein [Anaerolineales bacterium]